MCYVIGMERTLLLLPLVQMGYQAFMADGRRPEYGVDGTALNYFAYGEAGFSIHVTKDQKWLLIGAPGLMQWTGGVVRYSVLTAPGSRKEYFKSYQTFNTYYTTNITVDDYFGYSLDSGTFNPGDAVLGIAGAPRAYDGLGGVFIFDLDTHGVEMNLRGSLKGLQVGSYFGAAILVIDVNSDRRPDVIVGAPNFASDDEGSYDNGEAFVYLNIKGPSGFEFQLVDELVGSSRSKARFGTAMAELGDIDRDGYPEIAIGAPFEDSGKGAVYIYGGSSTGLHLVQRIPGDGERGFGISISRGVDVDRNGCNDLSVGAFESSSATIFRCRPTLYVKAIIIAPNATEIIEDENQFEVEFCIKSEKSLIWPEAVLELAVKLFSDSDSRVYFDKTTNFTSRIRSSEQLLCERRYVIIRENADRTKPIELFMEIEPVIDSKNEFCATCARASHYSILKASSGFIQLAQGCGEDLICTPDLAINIENLSGKPFVPGVYASMKVSLTLINDGEPAYASCVKIILPTAPKRLPSDCDFNKTSKLVCVAPHPLKVSKRWLLDIEPPTYSDEKNDITITVEVYDNCTSDTHKKVVNYTIEIEPKASLIVAGRTSPDSTIQMTEQLLDDSDHISFIHNFMISNMGPSTRVLMEFEIEISVLVEIEDLPQDCVLSINNTQTNTRIIRCVSHKFAAKSNRDYPIKMKAYLDEIEKILWKNGLLVFVSGLKMITPKNASLTYSMETLLVLLDEKRESNWFIICGAAISGLLLFTLLVLVLYKLGFFIRTHRDKLTDLKNEDTSELVDGNSTPSSLSTVSLNTLSKN